ncbi:hypothetical protein ACOSQ3_006828 [Xanthoceras sorbifolium]
MITNCFQHRRFVCWTWDCRWNPAKSEGFTEVQEDDKCICSGEQLRVDELIASSESLATRDYSASGYSSRAGKMDSKLDNSNIEEAESSGRESGYLNYENAQKGVLVSSKYSFFGELWALAYQIEELLPGVLERRERYCMLALCYYGEGEHMVALDLLRNLLNNRENPDCVLELLLASKICVENMICIQEGMTYARKALSELHGIYDQMASLANCLLGVLLSAQSRLVVSDSERILKQSEAFQVLGTAEKMMGERDPYIVFHLCLENAEQRKLDIALHYAKQLLKLESGSNVKGFILLARILSAQKRFVDAEVVINAALDQTGKWDQGELLRTKAKLQIAQGRLKKGIETYTLLLAVLQVQMKSFGAGKKLLKHLFVMSLLFLSYNVGAKTERRPPARRSFTLDLYTKSSWKDEN